MINSGCIEFKGIREINVLKCECGFLSGFKNTTKSS